MIIKPFHKINFENSSVDIFLGENIIESVVNIVDSFNLGKKIAIITDDNVYKLHSKSLKVLEEKYNVCWFVISHGEEFKTLKTVSQIYDFLNDNEITKSDLVIAFGGGVVGDITGFASSTYLRGLKYIQIPTTLLAQVDSSIGGKTGVDLRQGKNLVGVISQPKAIITDVKFLDTLDEKIRNDGIAEVIKYGFIKDSKILDLLKESFDKNKLEIIKKCVLIKSQVVEIDEFEKNIRMILNFGHTYGHSVEKLSDFKLSHGSSVAIGMVIAIKISQQLNLIDDVAMDRLIELLVQYKLPLKTYYTKDELNKVIQSDKKRRGDFINLILIDKIGQAIIKKTKLEDLINYNI